MYKMTNATHTGCNQIGSANLSMAYEMQLIDARIQFGIEVQMQLA